MQIEGGHLLLAQCLSSPNALDRSIGYRVSNPEIAAYEAERVDGHDSSGAPCAFLKCSGKLTASTTRRRVQASP